MAYFKKENAKIFYELYGEGKNWITLINGYTRPSSDFKLLGSFLAEHGRSVFTFDNRGCGQTEVPLDFSIEDIVRDVVDIWNALEVERSHVLGISMGAFIAQFLAIEQEQRIKSLCLVSTSMNRANFPVQSEWPKEENKIVERLIQYFHPDFAKKNMLLLQAMAKQISKTNSDGTFEKKAKAQREAIAKAKLDTNALKALKIPCLILHGREDQIIPYAEAEKLHQFIPNSQLHTYENTGHMILVEQRNDFFARTQSFFQD